MQTLPVKPAVAPWRSLLLISELVQNQDTAGQAAGATRDFDLTRLIANRYELYSPFQSSVQGSVLDGLAHVSGCDGGRWLRGLRWCGQSSVFGGMPWLRAPARPRPAPGHSSTPGPGHRTLSCDRFASGRCSRGRYFLVFSIGCPVRGSPVCGSLRRAPPSAFPVRSLHSTEGTSR